MRLKPGEPSSHPKIFKSPAAAAAAASVTAAYAIAKSDSSDFPPPPANPTLNGTGKSFSGSNIRNTIDSIKEEKRTLESSVAETQVENSKLREKIDEVNSTHAELSQVRTSQHSQVKCYPPFVLDSQSFHIIAGTPICTRSTYLREVKML